MPRVIVDPISVTPADLEEAARWLRQGGVVAFPTDTVYGLAADCTSERAVQAVFAIKGRGSHAALPLIAASTEQVSDFCGALSGATRRLADAFWPGPLSLIVAAPPQVAAPVSAGTGGVAIRVPAHAVARALAAAAGQPVTATSANRSGEPPAAHAGELGDLGRDARVLVIEAGAAPGGPVSTIVDARMTPPALIREGAIAWKRVLESLQE
jgi:L-threonylcarbamoyladenylate synthase